MLTQFDEIGAKLENTDVENRQKGRSHDLLGLEPVIAGFGACASCDCKGYERGSKENFCGKCGHHFRQHK